MDDAKQSFFPRMRRSNKQNKHRHLQTHRSGVTDQRVCAARPYISLKARMLGGQAETIMRLGV